MDKDVGIQDIARLEKSGHRQEVGVYDEVPPRGGAGMDASRPWRSSEVIGPLPKKEKATLISERGLCIGGNDRIGGCPAVGSYATSGLFGHWLRTNLVSSLQQRS